MPAIHDAPEHYTPQQYLPKALLGTYFYTPSDQGYEADAGARLERWRAAQREALNITETREMPDLDMSTITEIKQKHKASSGATKTDT